MEEVVVTIGFRTILRTVAAAALVVVAAVALDATRTVLGELALAAAVACLVRPAVLWLARRTRTGVALVVVFVGLLLGLAALLGGEARAISAGTKQLQHAVPDRLARLQDDLPAGNPVRTFLIEDDVVARVRHHINGIPSRFILGTDRPLQGASKIGLFLLIASLSAFMVTQAPTTLRRAISVMPASWRHPTEVALRTGYRAGGAYVRRTLALGVACGTAGGLLGVICGVPGAAVVALWLGMWALVPKIGIVTGGLPLLALAAGQGTAQGVGAAIGLVAIVGAGEWARRRWVERPTVTVGALLSLIAVMAGMEVGRWPGAVVALLGVAVLVAATEALPTRPPIASHASADGRRPLLAPTSSAGRGQGPWSRRIAVELDSRSIVLSAVVVLGLLVSVAFARSLPQSLTRLTLGVLVALALNPIVGVVQRRLHASRKGAVAIVVAGLLAAVVAFGVFAVPRAVQQGRQIPEQAPELVAQLDRAPVIGKAVRAKHLDERLRGFLDDLPRILATRDKTLQRAARSAGESMLAVSWMLLVTVAALLDGPTIADRVKRALPPTRRAKAERLGGLTYQAVGRTAAGSAFTALLQGAVVMVIGLALGIPLTPVLAANAALWTFVPQVGGLLAGAPLCVFGLSQGLWTGVAAGLLFLTWMLFNNHVLHAVIVGRAVHISPLASLVAVLVGASLGGFVGAIVATPLVGVVHALASSRQEAPRPQPVTVGVSA